MNIKYNLISKFTQDNKQHPKKNGEYSNEDK